MVETQERVAILIDGDGVPLFGVAQVMEVAARLGQVVRRRIYANWAKPGKQWQQICEIHRFEYMSHIDLPQSKNMTDMSLMLDGHKLYLLENIRCFCIFAHDNDYLPFVLLLRHEGVHIVGVGKQDAVPRALREAYSQFFNLGEPGTDLANLAERSTKVSLSDPGLRSLLKSAYHQVSATNQELWIELGMFSLMLRQHQASFEPRLYGYKNLSQLVEAEGSPFEIRRGSQYCLRLRE